MFLVNQESRPHSSVQRTAQHWRNRQNKRTRNFYTPYSSPVNINHQVLPDASINYTVRLDPYLSPALPQNAPAFSPRPFPECTTIDRTHPSCPTPSETSIEKSTILSEVPNSPSFSSSTFTSQLNDFETWLSSLPVHTDPLLPDRFRLGLGPINLEELRRYVSCSSPKEFIPVYFPDEMYPVLIPISVFHCIFQCHSRRHSFTNTRVYVHAHIFILLVCFYYFMTITSSQGCNCWLN